MSNTKQRGFFIGIGSNIEPKKHFPQIMTKLVTEFGKLWISKVIYTTPMGMTSKYLFLNSVLYLETELSPDELKQMFNTIEIALGRDRTDPLRNVKDRTADLDILFPISPDEVIDSNYLPKETYLHFSFIELATIMGKLNSNNKITPKEGVKLQLEGQTFGHTPCLISFQKRTEKIVVEMLE